MVLSSKCSHLEHIKNSITFQTANDMLIKKPHKPKPIYNIIIPPSIDNIYRINEQDNIEQSFRRAVIKSNEKIVQRETISFFLSNIK